MFSGSVAQAQESPGDDSVSAGATLPGETSGALPGIERVALPSPESSKVVLSGTFDYGAYGKTAELTSSSHRLGGVLAASWTPTSFLSLRGQLLGFVYMHPGDPEGADSSSYGEPEFALRAFGEVAKDLHLGAEAEVILVGAEAPSIDFEATTPTFRGLLGWNPLAPTWLGLQLGFRFDNTAAAIADPEALRAGDRFTLGASSWNAVEVGVGASHRLDELELLGEFSADILVGEGAPSFGQSPISLAVGARYALSRAVCLRGMVDISPSARPEPFPTDVLVPVRPRLAISAGLNWRFGVGVAAKPEPEEVESIEVAPAATATTARVEGQVVDEGGRPVPDVEVLLTFSGATEGERAGVAATGGDPSGSEALQSFTDAEGRFAFEDVPVGTVFLHTSTAGFDPTSQEIAAEQVNDDEPAESIEIVIYEAVPEGQVRGRVLDVGGQVVRATITITPGSETIEVNPDGTFSVDLPPGRYNVRFTQAGYRTQYRSIVLDDRGVVVLNIALQK